MMVDCRAVAIVVMHEMIHPHADVCSREITRLDGLHAAGQFHVLKCCHPN